MKTNRYISPRTNVQMIGAITQLLASSGGAKFNGGGEQIYAR